MIPFPPFEPDRTKFAVGASINIINCLPVADGWGPFADLDVISTALPDTFKGGVWIRTSTGTYRIIAATTAGIYEYNTATLGWTALSTGFGLPDGDEWSFCVFGLNLFATNITDGLWYMAIDAGTSFTYMSAAPKAKYVWSSGDYLVLGHHETYQKRVQTSGLSDASFWTVGERGCDYQDLPDGGEVMGGISAPDGAIIIQREAIRAMANTIGDYSFSISVLNPSRGTIAPLSIAQIGPGQFLYYSPDGFFMGAEGTPIGRERVDRWFDETIDRTYIHEIKAMVDPFNKVVLWQAKKPNATRFILGYHWGLDRWFYGEDNLTGALALVTPGISIDAMDLYYATIDDASSVSFDSRLFTGGTPVMAVFDTSNRLCSLTGTPRAATLDTADVELTPGRRSFLQEVTVVTDCPTYTLKAITSDFAGGTRTVGSAVTPFSTTGISHFRSSAKYHAFRMEVAAGINWKHIVGLEPKLRQEGRR